MVLAFLKFFFSCVAWEILRAASPLFGPRLFYPELHLMTCFSIFLPPTKPRKPDFRHVLFPFEYLFFSVESLVSPSLLDFSTLRLPKTVRLCTCMNFFNSLPPPPILFLFLSPLFRLLAS